MNKKLLLNIACGEVYSKNKSWINIDIASNSKNVKKYNILSKLPFASNSVDAIYCSHFLEHIPINKVNDFLLECHRILKKNGVMRLVLPDFEALSREYLKQIKLKNFKYSKIVLLSIIDQCVRKKPGGELDKYYRRLIEEKESRKDEINFINYLNGVNFKNKNKKKKNSLQKIGLIYLFIWEKLFLYWIKLATYILPKSFKDQNISFARTGEIHQWVWDYFTLKEFLVSAGFKKVFKMTFDKTKYKGSKLYKFDVDKKIKVRGIESMYIETIKI